MGDISQHPPTTPPLITHIVLFKYKKDITWINLQSHFDVFLRLKEKCIHPDTGRSYMVSMRAGRFDFFPLGGKLR
jgi:hypothetical protein